MPSDLSGVILSDLDGTFLDHEYRPALDCAALASVLRRWRVIWVTSRTADELLHMRATLGNPDVAIGENGGVCIAKSESVARALGRATALDHAWLARVGAPYRETLAFVERAFTACGATLRTAADVTVQGFARVCRYGVDDAKRALRRRASVLLVGTDTADPRVAQALGTLRSNRCDVAPGGRWTCIVAGANKGTTAQAVLSLFEEMDQRPPRIIAAIGNAPNDAPLLSVAHQRFVIRDPRRDHERVLSEIPGVHLLRRPGTAGWLEMIETLDRLSERAA